MGIVKRLRAAWAAHKAKEEDDRRDMGYLFAAGALLSGVETDQSLGALTASAKDMGDYDAFDTGVDDARRDYCRLLSATAERALSGRKAVRVHEHDGS